MVLVAAWVAEVYVGADETLLVAQQDHDLCREKGEREGGESVCRKDDADIVCTRTRPHTFKDVHGARTCCGGSCPLPPLSPAPLVLCWVHWC